MKNIKNGFSLVELMVVIAIIAILASVGIPAYNNYILKNHRSEAVSEILGASSAIDSYEIKNGEFPAGTDISTVWHQTTTNNLYDLSYCSGEPSCSNFNYTVTATAKGSQANDTPCSTITLEVRGAIENRIPTECWQ